MMLFRMRCIRKIRSNRFLHDFHRLLLNVQMTIAFAIKVNVLKIDTLALWWLNDWQTRCVHNICMTSNIHTRDLRLRSDKCCARCPGETHTGFDLMAPHHQTPVHTPVSVAAWANGLRANKSAKSLCVGWATLQSDSAEYLCWYISAKHCQIFSTNTMHECMMLLQPHQTHATRRVWTVSKWGCCCPQSFWAVRISGVSVFLSSFSSPSECVCNSCIIRYDALGFGHTRHSHRCGEHSDTFGKLRPKRDCCCCSCDGFMFKMGL